MSNENTSTLQSYVDSATGAAQSALGSLTGSAPDKNQAADKKADAQAKDDLSHAGTNIAGHSVSAEGVAQNDPNRQTGSYNQTMGSAKETFGNLVGAEGLKQQGQQQNQEGKEQEAKGQLSDLGSGVKDRVGGTMGNAYAAATGDREAQEQYQQQHDKGKTLERGAEAAIEKQGDAKSS